MTYTSFEQKYRTGEVKKIKSRLVSAGVEELIDLNRRVMKIPLGELVKEYNILLSNKPKRFILGILPNSSYNFEMVDWEYLEKLMRNLLNQLGEVEWYE